jgi:hypothetical protein
LPDDGGEADEEVPTDEESWEEARGVVWSTNQVADRFL